MTIAEARGKCKSFIGKIPRDALVLGIIVLASLLSFSLGYMAGIDVGQGILESPTVTNADPSTSQRQVVASKSGTKYYFKSCAGAKRITEANKIIFISTSAAEEAGYSLASNCKDF